MTRRRILFVCRAASGESVKAAQALATLDNVEVETADVSDLDSLMAVADSSFERIVTAQETLLEIVAIANERLGLPGLSVETVRNTLDKSRLKSTLERVGLHTPRYTLATDLRTFISEIGFPIVLKSVAGSGALATFPIRNENDLGRLSLSESFLAEQYIDGQELCVDTITINNEPQFHSICCYKPSILEAVEHPETQWSCVMPREMDSYKDFIAQGLKAIRALSVGNAMTHMEGFIDSIGRAWFTDATLRPAGARIAPMLAHAYDIDPYRVWARVVVDGCFDGPWERKYAVGTVFLRGLGAGTVEHVEGIARVQREFAHLLVDARWPRMGAHKSATYTGDGFVTVRDPKTAVVEDALTHIAQSVKITYSSEPETQMWSDRLQNLNELNRPAWDQAN